MSTWIHRVEIEVGDKRPAEVARELAERLRALPENYRECTHGSTTLDEIIDWLDAEASNPNALEDNVDPILRELYDWGDHNRLWVFLK